MADPVTLLLVAGTAVSAAGALSSGVQARRSADQQAAAAEYNAAVSQNQATQAFAAGAERENIQRRQAAQQLSSQRAAFAESGLDPNSGSALEIQLQSTRNAELDALQTRYEGILSGQNYEQQAALGVYEGGVLRASGRNAQGASYLTAAGNLLAGGAAAGRAAGRSMSNPAPVVERSVSSGIRY